MHQSATYWDVTLYFVDDAVDADCTCPHGCVVEVDFARRRGSVGVDRWRLWLVVACNPRCDAPFKCKHTCACLVKAWSIKHPEVRRAWRCKLAVRGRVPPLDFSRRRDHEWARTLPRLARLRADGTTKTIYKPIEPSNVLTALLDNQNMDDETRRQWALRLEAMPGVKSIRPAIASPRTLRAPLARRAAARWQWVQRARHRCNEFKQYVVEQSAVLLEARGTAPTCLALKEPHDALLRKVRFRECTLRDPFISIDPLVNEHNKEYLHNPVHHFDSSDLACATD